MHGTAIQRTARLFTFLLTHPHMVPLYLRQSVRKSASPIDLELPWITFAAIDYLKRFVQPHHVVAEFGGGGSTLFFARRVASVHCIESDPDWASRVEQAVTERGLTNVSVDVRFRPRGEFALERRESIEAYIDRAQEIVRLSACTGEQ